MFADFVAQNVLLFVALAVITLMLLYSYVGDRFLGYQQVSPEEATRLYNQGAIVVDVRSDAEFKTGYIGEARHISSSEFKDKMSTLDHFKDKQILVYCQSGARSGGAASQLVKAGFSQVANLRGGVLAWKMAGLPLNQPVSKKARRKGKGAA